MPSDRNGKIVGLTGARLRRFEQRVAALEEGQRGTNARLDQAVDVLTRLVRVVSAQNDRVNRNFAQLGARLERLTRAIVKGRTEDTRRVSRVERRLEAAERRLVELETRR